MKKGLYWSSYNVFKCPQRFIWKYGFEGIDFGNGPGKPKSPDNIRSEHHAIMGTVIQSVVEDFYNNKLYIPLIENPTKEELRNTISVLSKKTKDKFSDEIYSEKKYINWREAPTASQMEKVCVDGVIGYIKTAVANYLFGEINEAEKHIVIDSLGDTGIKIGAKIDLYIERPNDSKHNPGITIVDGKNSKYMGKYLDKDQLLFYAVCVFLQKGVMPDRLGFVHYRFPYGNKISHISISKGVDWINFTSDDVVSMMSKIIETGKKLDTYKPEDFFSNPSPKMCRFCEWECEARKLQREANSKIKSKKNAFVLDNIGSDGFSDISLEETKWK